MPKLVLDDISNLYGNTTAAETSLNNNFTKIEQAIENTVSRNGVAPNQMSANIDMNSNRVTNMAPGINPSDAATVSQVQAIDSPNLEMSDLTDVEYAGNGPNIGDLLSWNGTAWVPVPTSVIGGVSVINDLQDVTVSSPIAQQVLGWNGTQWVNQTNPVGVTDHGVLTGLGDDDHLQYATEARGDARWAARATTLAGTNSIAGGGDLTGNRTFALVNDSATPQGSNYYGTSPTGVKGWHTLPAALTDHGALSGLGDDDHPQYINQSRGAALYASTTHTHSQYADTAATQTILGQWTFNTTPRAQGGGAFLFHGDSGQSSGRITVSTSPPSGGADGDIWIVLV